MAQTTHLSFIPSVDENDGRRRAMDVVKKWGLSNPSLSSDISDIMKKSLFDDQPLILFISEKNSLESVLHQVKENPALYEDGLLIVSTCNPSSKAMKEFPKVVESLGGLAFSERSEKVKALLSEVFLTREVKDEILSYVGEDSDSLLPIVNDVSKLPRRVQESMTWEDIRIRLPQSPGEVMPWGGYDKETRRATKGVDDYLDLRDARGAMARIQRVLEGGGNAIMITSWLIKSYEEILALKTLMQSGSSPSSAARTLGLPNPSYYGKKGKDPVTGKSGYPTKLRIERAGRLSNEFLSSALNALADADSLLKSGSMRCVMTPKNIMMRMVVEICD